MFYEPKREVEVKANPFKLESLIAWAEKQPPEKEYDFWCNHCYLSQYFAAHGYEIDIIGTGTVTFHGGECIDLPPHFNWIAQTGPYTFGSALARARKIAFSIG